MGERVIVRQNKEFEIEILAAPPDDLDGGPMHPVDDVRHLTPYGMLLAGLGSCTSIVLHTYAQYHDVRLDEVEMRLVYDRVYAEDCKECEQDDEFREQIELEIALSGDLSSEERKHLFVVSRHCPIHKMLSHGITVAARLADDTPGEDE